MKISVSNSMEQLGEKAAQKIAEIINFEIEKKGYSRIVLSTGASQFSTLEQLLTKKVDWSKVTMFHLDEYVGLPESHVASFRKYLKERFIQKIPNLKEAVLVNGEAENLESELKRLTERLREDVIDVGVIGIGENAHIAFNDPPANFDTKEAYIVLNLSDTCKAQQVGEGWFATANDVPKQAISMTCHEIMQCKIIVSPVPNKVKANAIYNMLSSKKCDNNIPATLLKKHEEFYLYLDNNSASLCGNDLLKG